MRKNIAITSDLVSLMKGTNTLKISQTIFKLGSFLQEMEEAYAADPSLRDCLVDALKKIMAAHPSTNPPAPPSSS